MLWSLLIQYILFEKKYICICKKNIMNVIKVKLCLCESRVKSLKTLLFDVMLSGTNILRDVYIKFWCDLNVIGV